MPYRFLILLVFLLHYENIIFAAEDLAYSLRQEVIEQSFKRSLVEVKELVAHAPQPTCFISRVCMPDEHPDAVWSDRIESYLRQAGVRTIYDKNDLRGGDGVAEFVKQIGSADFVMALFTPDYKKNYEVRTWIYTEAQLIRNRLETSREFFIPILFAGSVVDSISPDYLDSDILYYPMTKGEEDKKNPTDWGECFECLFRVLKEKFFRGVLEEETKFERIREKFVIRKEKLRSLFPHTEFQSASGFFPQSLKSYKAFLDRTDGS